MIPPLASMSSSPLVPCAAGSPLHDLGGAAKEKRGKTSQERPTNNSLLAPEEKGGEENCVGIGKKTGKEMAAGLHCCIVHSSMHRSQKEFSDTLLH